MASSVISILPISWGLVFPIDTLPMVCYQTYLNNDQIIHFLIYILCPKCSS